MIALLAITTLGGFLRFYRIDRPYVWGDEASTYRRVSGTYDEMLKTLERDPFTPLFYSFEWALRTWGHVHLTPFWLRLLPAIAGTLMVPAMYFLARQLTSVRTSIVVAVLTCCSSWLINYSRDAKMYMTFWLFVALTAGCFFWWLRKHTWTSWLCWIAAGCAMMGLNGWGGVLMALLPIFLLTARRVHWVMGLGFLVGTAVIVSGFVGYMTLFNNYIDKAEDNRSLEGINWVPWRNQGADGPDMVRDSASAFLYSFTFLQENFPDTLNDDVRKLRPPKPILIGAIVALTVIGSLMALGAMPWRRADLPPPLTTKEPWWRATLWIGLWLTVPTYLFYCMSFSESEAPSQWLATANDFLGGRWWVFAILAVGIAWPLTWWKPAGTWLLAITVVALLGLLGLAFLRQYRLDLAPEHLWYRPIGAITDWLTQLRSRNILWPLLVVIPAIAIARSATTWKRRGGHVLATVLISAAVFAALAGVYLIGELVKDDMRRRGIGIRSMWVPRYLGFIWPALAIALSAMLVRLPTWPLRYTAIASIVALNLTVAYNRALNDTEAPLDRVMADIVADKSGASTRTFVPPPQVSGGPGATTWYGITGSYYLLHDRDDVTIAPAWMMREEYVYRRANVTIRTEDRTRELAFAAREPGVRRIVIWRAQEAPDKPLRPAKEIATRIGPNWELASEEVIPVRYHWCWATRYVYVRREFVKKDKPTTQPIAQVETNR